LTKRIKFVQTGEGQIGGNEMKFKFEASFFGHLSSHSTATATSRDVEKEYHQAKAAWVIQRWWKQLHLKQTASESYRYMHDMVSLEQAQQDSFNKLEKFLLDPKTIATTKTLLMHLEQTKDIVLPSRARSANAYKAERQFLTAYMIATKSKFLFESPTDVDELLLVHAQDMLKSFEVLCAFMNKIYFTGNTTLTSPLTDTSPAAGRVLSNLGSERLNHDHRFITEGHRYLEDFHNKQMAYYDTFANWEVKNRTKLAQILINTYLELEAKRFTLLNSLDPRMLELYEGYGKQQETLKRRVRFLLGEEESNRIITEEVGKLQTSLEEKKWTSSSSELLIHEIALNPKLQLTANACAISPRSNVDAAITALTQSTPETDLILTVLGEISTHLAMFTPNNREQVLRLQHTYSRQAMNNKIETHGISDGLYTIIVSLFEEIKHLESPGHVRETDFFLEDIAWRANHSGDPSPILKEAIDYFYYKISQINLETKNFQIQQARGLIEKNIASLEQKEFQDRLAKKQFNLSYTLSWFDKFVCSPEEYRLNTPIFCSKYLGSHASHALMIAVLQQPAHNVLHTIPETFYLDRVRLVKWHARYQNLRYTVTTLGYLDTFCQDNGLRLTSVELAEEKKRLLTLLETGIISRLQEKVDDFLAVVGRLLARQNKELSALDKSTFASLIEQCSEGTNQVSSFINQRLGDQLSIFFFKGRLPEASTPFVQRFSLKEELNKLGKEILPVLRLHNKVHGAYYQRELEVRIWKPLFNVLRQTKAAPLPSLFMPEEESIVHARNYMHKLAFVLTGLSLIQQSIVHSDVWNLNLTIKNNKLKELATTYGLVDMIKDPRVEKDVIENKLMELMQHVANEYELPYEALEKREMARMIRLAKNEERSLGAKSFLDEITRLTKHYAIDNKQDINPQHLIYEFKEEVKQLGVNTKAVIEKVKLSHLPEDLDPIAATIPVLRAGRTLEESTRFKM
jgi:hypothetical protein